MEKETNFYDLCAACGRAIGSGCKALWRVLTQMLRLSYRYWWLVITIVVLFIAAALYYSRTDNLTLRVNAIAVLNGPSIQQFEQAYMPLRSGQLLPTDAAITELVHKRKIWNFETYRVIDCLDDGVADYVDFKHKSSPTDTVKVQMQDHLCLQFRIKYRNRDSIPMIESDLLALLNSRAELQKSYETFMVNLRDEVAFNHAQAHKLDSLTTHYYFYSPSGMEPNAYVGTGVNFYGDRRIRLFLDEIYEQQEHLRLDDYRLQLATAPVVLENHFTVDPKPVNGRRKCVLLFFLFGWFSACALAEIIDKRKAIISWLKQ